MSPTACRVVDVSLIRVRRASCSLLSTRGGAIVFTLNALTIQIECVIDLFPEVRCHLDPSILPMDANTIVPAYAVDYQSALAPIDLPETNVATIRMTASLLYNS